jgi:hypothetical protein
MGTQKLKSIIASGISKLILLRRVVAVEARRAGLFILPPRAAP